MSASDDQASQEKSVEQALEDFVAQANSNFAEDYDGWDIASNIDKFVEQARTQPVEVEAPKQRAEAISAAEAGAIIVEEPPQAPVAKPEAIPPTEAAAPSRSGVTPFMFLGGIVLTAAVSAALVLVIMRVMANDTVPETAIEIAQPAATLKPAAAPAAEKTTVAAPAPIAAPAPAPVAAPAPAPVAAAAAIPSPKAEPKAADVPAPTVEDTQPAASAWAKKVEEAKPAVTPAKAEAPSERPASASAKKIARKSETKSEKPAAAAKKKAAPKSGTGWVDPFAQ